MIDTLSELSVIRQIQNVENVDHTRRSDERFILFYSESRKRELKTKPIYECRSDERLKTKSERSARLSYTELLGRFRGRGEFFFIREAGGDQQDMKAAGRAQKDMNAAGRAQIMELHSKGKSPAQIKNNYLLTDYGLSEDAVLDIIREAKERNHFQSSEEEEREQSELKGLIA